MRRKIANFEADSNFEQKLKNLMDSLNDNKTPEFYISKYNEIGYYTKPKSFENNIVDEDSLIVTNRYMSEQYDLGGFNFFTDLPIELHIINILWIMKLGYLLDSQYCHYLNKEKSYCYANKLEIDEETKKIKNGNKLFKTYSYQYQQWRDDCIETAEDLLQNHKKDVIIVSLDIKSYYPTANLDYSQVNEDLRIRCNNKDISDDFDNYSFLTEILGKIRDEYYKLIKPLTEKEEKKPPKEDNNEQENIKYSEMLIPIGMLSSNVIANWYLRIFDERVNKYVKPAYYGRYVDDILIVLENHGDCEELAKEDGICDKSCCVENKKLSVHKILKQYFCGCNPNKCATKILESDKIEENDDNKNISNSSSKDTKEIKNDNYYININNSKLKIQGKKVKLFIFDANSTKAMLKKFKETIKRHSSEFRFLPDEDRIQEDFVQETYSIDYNDTINKLRSIDKYQLDKFKISSFLAKQLMLAKYSKNNSNYNQTKEEILFAFSGRMGLELFNYWDKVLTYFLLNKDKEAFCDFSKNILENIQRIQYGTEDILNNIKSNLYKHLLESIYLSLALNPNFIYKKDNLKEINKDFKSLQKKFENLPKNIQNLDKFDNIFENNKEKGYKNNIDNLLDSSMIKHKYCYMPILNYVKRNPKNPYIDFTDENIFKEFTNINDVLDDEAELKIMFNPKRFSFDEIMLFKNLKYIANCKFKTEKKSVVKEKEEQELNINKNFFEYVFKQAIEDYIKLNYGQYNPDNEKLKSRKVNIKRYLTDLKKEFKENSKSCEQGKDLKQEESKKHKNNNKYYMEFNSNGNHSNVKLSKFVIGLYNTKITDKSITDNLIKPQAPIFDDVQKLIKFLNLAIEDPKIKCNMIVFPEVCIPHQTLGLLADFSKKHNVAIVCGLKHITVNNTVLNLIATILPFNIGNYNNSYINFRLKEWYSPSEIKEIKKYGKTIPYDHITKEYANNNNLFVWNGLHFAVYDCFELADTNYRCEYKSLVDMIIACEWNKDLDYFNNIIKSAARDIHCYVTQVNTSQFGDSKVIAPKKSSEMTLLNIKGGEDNILIGKLNIEELREFQRKETEYLEEKDKIFKPLPPAFQKETSRLTKNKN